MKKRKVEVSRAEVVAAYQELTGFFADKQVSPRAAYAVVKLKKALEPEVDAIEEARKKVASHIEAYETERVALAEKYAKKDDSGRPIIEDNRYVIEEAKREEFAKELEKLREKHKDALNAFAEAQVEFNNFLEEKVELEVAPLDMGALESSNMVVPVRVIEALEPFLI